MNIDIPYKYGMNIINKIFSNSIRMAVNFSLYSCYILKVNGAEWFRLGAAIPSNSLLLCPQKYDVSLRVLEPLYYKSS